MRILTVSTHEAGGGTEKIARDLVQGYQKGGHESWLAVGFPDAGAQRSLALSRDRHLQPRNPAAPPPLPFEDRKRTLLQGREDMYYPASWDLFDLVPAVPDILHCHNLHGHYFDLRALPWLSRQAPTVLTLHDRWLLAGNCAHPLGCERWRTGCGDCPDTTIYPGIPADGTAANWRMKRDIFRTSRLHIAAPCRWLMDKVDESILAAGAVERRVIRQGVDTTVFAPGDKRAERALLGLPADALILLFCANGLRNNRWKDFQGLRQTLERLSERFKDRSLRLIGLGEDAPPERVGTAEVIFVPFQKDPAVVARYYRAADLYVHMAQAETYPNTVMEALCCGTPVVATAVGGIAEQVDSAVPYEGFAYGNATAATAFLNGLAVEEMPLPLLDIGDLDYEVTVAVKVTRAVPPHPAGPARRHGAGIGKPPVILMYHRVADLALDPQCLAVRPERFAAHLEVLHGIGRVMPLADLVAAMTTGDVPDGAVAVTFDDGYADNLGVAAPLLEAHGVPATVFVTAGALEDDREFWWDELERTLLWPGRLPRQLFLPTRFGGIGSDFGEAAAYSLDDFTRDREWTVLAPHAPTERHAFYQRLQRVLHTTHDPRERRRLLDALIAAVDAAPPRRRASHRALTKAEVARLAAGGLIEVGAHTVNHPVLAALSLDEQEREITEGRDALERLIGRPVRLFAYPFGYADSFAKETVALVRKAGFVGACTTMPEPVAALGDPWQLPRMAVRDWTAAEFERRFRQFRGDVS